MSPLPATWASLAAGLVAVFSVLMYATIFRHPYELRKARAFLSFAEYERIITLLAMALTVASVVLLVALVTDPAVIDLHDLITYALVQLMLAGGFLFTYRQARQSGN